MLGTRIQFETASAGAIERALQARYASGGQADAIAWGSATTADTGPVPLGGQLVALLESGEDDGPVVKAINAILGEAITPAPAHRV